MGHKSPEQIEHLLTRLGIQTRFHKTMEDYCKGVLDHVYADLDSALPTAEEELEVRRQSAGVTPLYALIE